MGLLLMSYEYQRATREVSVHQAAKVRFNNQAERCTKRVSRMESVFDKAKSRIETNYRQLSSQASNNVQQAMMSQDLSSFAAMISTIVIGGIPLTALVQVPSSVPNGQNITNVLATLGSQARTAIDQLINMAKEAETTAIEDQEENMLEPIREKGSDLEAKAGLEDTLITMWQTRQEAAKSHLGEGIKNTMGSYGLS